MTLAGAKSSVIRVTVDSECTLNLSAVGQTSEPFSPSQSKLNSLAQSTVFFCKRHIGYTVRSDDLDRMGKYYQKQI